MLQPSDLTYTLVNYSNEYTDKKKGKRIIPLTIFTVSLWLKFHPIYPCLLPSWSERQLHHTAASQSKEGAFWLVSFAQFLCSIAAATVRHPEKLFALTSKHQLLHQHIKVPRKGLGLWNYGNDNCCIIGPCVPHNYYKSLLELLIKSPINSWCICVQCSKSNGFCWHRLGDWGGGWFYTPQFIEPVKHTAVGMILCGEVWERAMQMNRLDCSEWEAIKIHRGPDKSTLSIVPLQDHRLKQTFF